MTRIYTTLKSNINTCICITEIPLMNENTTVITFISRPIRDTEKTITFSFTSKRTK